MAKLDEVLKAIDALGAKVEILIRQIPQFDHRKVTPPGRTRMESGNVWNEYYDVHTAEWHNDNRKGSVI